MDENTSLLGREDALVEGVPDRRDEEVVELRVELKPELEELAELGLVDGDGRVGNKALAVVVVEGQDEGRNGEGVVVLAHLAGDVAVEDEGEVHHGDVEVDKDGSALHHDNVDLAVRSAKCGQCLAWSIVFVSRRGDVMIRRQNKRTTYPVRTSLLKGRTTSANSLPFSAMKSSKNRGCTSLARAIPSTGRQTCCCRT